MKWQSTSFSTTALAAVASVTPIYASAKIYVSVEQAQKILFPNTALTAMPVLLSDAVQKEMTKASSVRHPFRGERVWRASDGSWLVVDEVVGKHEMITYAVAIKADGSVKGVEILEYVESYGYEVAEASWRNQFVGKQVSDAVRLGSDIQNISGATLSCKHLTDGIKRLLVMHQLVLKNMAAK
jgi:Na+-transporting NADH:ubiquinone oxidoreductase subunit NqrC